MLLIWRFANCNHPIHLMLVSENPRIRCHVREESLSTAQHSAFERPFYTSAFRFDGLDLDGLGGPEGVES
jgi:hypothetical protein